MRFDAGILKKSRTKKRTKQKTGKKYKSGTIFSYRHELRRMQRACGKGCVEGAGR
jgi:hypothetical protein